MDVLRYVIIECGMVCVLIIIIATINQEPSVKDWASPHKVQCCIVITLENACVTT